MAAFDNLVQNIGQALGTTSGLDSEDIDHQHLIGLMESYTSEQSDWEDFALFDEHRNYTRNLVDDTNGKSNILIVCWNPGKGSAIHDHADSHCIMKMLKGSLRETVYLSPEQSDTTALEPMKETVYDHDQVTYISDKIGLHKIENTSQTETAISLHLYTPPHIHNYGFNLFDQATGKRMHIKSGPIFSIHGEKCPSTFSAGMQLWN